MYNKETCFCCLVVGSRSINDYNIVREKLDSIIPQNTYETILILSGGANGVDELAERYKILAAKTSWLAAWLAAPS